MQFSVTNIVNWPSKKEVRVQLSTPYLSSDFNMLTQKLFIYCFILLLMGCQHSNLANFSPRLERHTLLEVQPILAHYNIARPQFYSLELKDPFEISDEMRRFAQNHAPKDSSVRSRTIALTKALLLDAGGGPLRYQSQYTYTAKESFESREANCLSFSILYAKLAQLQGLKVDFNEVDVPPAWDELRDGSWVSYKHVNVIVEQPFERDVFVDINLDAFSTSYPQKIVADRVVKALFYGNVGVEAMREKHMLKSARYLVEAIKLAPEEAHLWVNLGALYSKHQFFDYAEASYLHALKIDSAEMSAASNLARLLRSEGREHATFFENMVSSYINRNPYYNFYMAKRAFDLARYDESMNLVNRAIKEVKEAKFFHLRAKIHVKIGDGELAKIDIINAEKYATLSDRDIYQKKLEKISKIYKDSM
ncbi:hypothetical protein L1F30_04390 [Simiduia sp. 21SJ11W-1]|uniref:tetratricopeptide repeat protein n=1 Tax=Simiduia sp. 21SJ11W-1 TaxID=2909669 RepID=UPI0020A08D4E|nr:hypothetical protein [Simiduia sp. 21SJ11W-1]UTA48787.1 hypothetical protein L1F30_04390 [Simiduia sp. 21SJ11W-1]